MKSLPSCLIFPLYTHHWHDFLLLTAERVIIWWRVNNLSFAPSSSKMSIIIVAWRCIAGHEQTFREDDKCNIPSMLSTKLIPDRAQGFILTLRELHNGMLIFYSRNATSNPFPHHSPHGIITIDIHHNNFL